MADVQDSPSDELAWDLRALQAADLMTDERVRQAGVATPVTTFYPSSHPNLGEVYRKLGDLARAREQLGFGREAAAALGDDGYGRMVKRGLAGLTRKMADQRAVLLDAALDGLSQHEIPVPEIKEPAYLFGVARRFPPQPRRRLLVASELADGCEVGSPVGEFGVVGLRRMTLMAPSRLAGAGVGLAALRGDRGRIAPMGARRDIHRTGPGLMLGEALLAALADVGTRKVTLEALTVSTAVLALYEE